VYEFERASMATGRHAGLINLAKGGNDVLSGQ
jgi:hypothetical protein